MPAGIHCSNLPVYTVNEKFQMLVLCNVSGQAFQAFLSGLRTQKTPVALKAMTTEHNLSWSSSKLHGELAAEHENMKKVQKTIHK